MPKRVGTDTVIMEHALTIVGFAGVAGKKEKNGPLGSLFDRTFEDDKLGQDSWEAAESGMLCNAISLALQKANLKNDQVQLLFAGDLLDQSIASTFGVKQFGIPHIGLFGACSTMALSMGMAAIAVDSGAAQTAVAATGSHFCSAERQFRFPLEYGGKRTPTSQWTVTGSGAAVLQRGVAAPQVKAVTFGRIQDYGVTDANNMGAAMAPAACSTLKAYFDDTHTTPADFDLVLTGDLGQVGSQLLKELLQEQHYTLGENYNDCGLMIFNMQDKEVGAGGSGCGCSGSVVCSKILSELQNGTLSRVLFCATGALMSPTSSQQGLSIPAIAHAVELAAK